MIGMGFGAVGMILFWVALVALAVWLVGALFPRSGRPELAGDRPIDALSILAQRYARGELTHEQYESMKRVLTDPLG